MRVGGLVAVPLAMLVGAATVGCAKGPTSAEVTVGPPTGGLLSEAAGRTRAMGTGRIEGTFSMHGSLAFFGEATTLGIGFGFTGEYDLGQHRNHLLATLRTYEESSPGTTSRSSGSSTSARNQPGDTYEVVTDGDRYFERQVESGQVKQVDGREWVRKARKPPDADPLNAVYRVSGLGESGQAVDPDTLLDQIQNVSDDVTELDHETVRDTDTRHLRASVSVLRLYDEAARTTGTTVAQKRTCVRDTIRDQTITIDVFIGTDGFVRRVTASGELGKVFDASVSCADHTTVGTGAPHADASTFSYSTSIDYFDLGQPVTITVPDPAGVAENETFTPVGTVIS